jgi:hypothetical protein
MKFAAIAIVAASTLITTQASAFDLGYGLKAGGEVDMNYTTGVETWALEATPEVGFEALGVDITIGSTFNLLDINGNDPFKGLDFSAEYDLGVIGANGLTAYGEVDTDKDLEFGDLKMGVKFAF